MKEVIRAVKEAIGLRKGRRLFRHHGTLEDLEQKVTAYYRSAEGKAYYNTLSGMDLWNDMIRRDQFLDLCTRSKTIVDFGCGAGGLALALAEHFSEKSICAIDTGRHAGTLLANPPGNLMYKQGSVLDSMYPDNSMDLVISRFIIEHIVYPDRMLKEIHRILSPRGRLYLLYPHLMLKVNFSTMLREVASWAFLSNRPLYLDPQINSETGRADDSDAVWLTSPVKISRILRSCGFTVTLSRLTQSLIVARKA